MDRNAATEVLLAKGWSRETLAIWIRAKGCCEYCGKDLQAHADDYLFGFNIDHVIAASIGGPDHLDNYALACRACNLIKRNRDFRNGEPNSGRDVIIARAREYIAAQREINHARLQEVLPLLASCGLNRP